MRQMLLQNAIAILLQNETEVYCKMRQVFYYKMRQFYNKMRQLLQNAIILLQNATVIKKCGVCYKLRQYNINGSPRTYNTSATRLKSLMFGIPIA